MNPIEESVRRALEGGNPSDHAFRQSIYAASARAMERMVGSRGLDEAAAGAERARLAEVVERVEAEYAAYYGGADPVASAPPEAAPAAVPAPSRSPASFETRAARPAPEEPEAPAWTPGANRPASANRPRRPGRKVLLALLFLALLLAFFAWAISVFGPAAEEGMPTADATTGVTGPAGTPPAGTVPAWISAFTGEDLELVSTPEGGRVTAVSAAQRPAVRLAGPEGTEAEILVALGPGLVGQLTGSGVRVELVAGSPDGALREFSVRCLFAGQSVCDSQRFATSMPEEAFVFDIEVPEGASTPASLAIEPGLSAQGRDVDLYSVRMRVL